MSATRSLEISAEIAAQEREQKKREIAEARHAGGLAYHAAIKHIDGEPAKEAAAHAAKEAAAHAAFMSGNPYPMIAYGDEGHQRPAWFEGFNSAMAALYGVREPKWQVKGEERPRELNGYSRLYSHRLETYEQAIAAAERLSEEQGAQYWAEDRGANVSPRYAVIRAFTIGEPVSYGFNGDSYPCGRIIAMSAWPKDASKGVGPRIITVQDHNGNRKKFWRRRLTGSWKNNETWSLQHGWHSDRNPSF